MSMFKFNPEKIKEKLEKEKEKFENAKNRKERDITKDPLLKVAEAGEYNFRAVPYIHNEDFISDPFPERWYHFGIPGQPIFYCPEKNNREKCAICDFIWERLKESKGKRDEYGQPLAKTWNKYLPQRRVWIPGILRGRESEGLKYFPLSTLEDKMGKSHEQLFKWLQGKNTYFMLDPESGFDLIMKYEAYDAKRSAALGGAKFGFAGFDLDREETPISDNPEETWAEIERTMKNVDTDLDRYSKKTEEDALEVLQKWLDIESRRSKREAINKPIDSSKDDDGTMIESDVSEVGDDDKPIAVEKEVAAIEKAAPISNDDRKAKARQLLMKKIQK